MAIQMPKAFWPTDLGGTFRGSWPLLIIQMPAAFVPQIMKQSEFAEGGDTNAEGIWRNSCLEWSVFTGNFLEE